MSNRNNWWFFEADAGNPGDEPTAGQTPNAAPGMGQNMPMQAPPDQQQEPGQQRTADDDVTQDPQEPEMSDEQKNDQDFEQWKHEFLQLAIKADTEEMIDAIGAIRDREGLEPSQRKFVEDNLNILLYRRDGTIENVSKQIRKLIKEDLDRTNPGTTIMQHIMSQIEAEPVLGQTLLKLTGTFGWKGELHRKWLAALLGAVQVGGGSKREDLIYNDVDYNINISTRFYTEFGEINIGKWSLLSTDPQKYLQPPELQRLQEGSPEEKQVLRRRVIMESIAAKFKTRAFLINVAGQDGTIYSIGWDLGNCLIDAYKEGKLVVRGKENTDKEAMIGDDGAILPVIDYSIYYVQETGEVDDDGRPESEEVPFMERRDDVLYLKADLDTIRNGSSGMSGIFFKEVPYNGNPSDILKLQRCLPNLPAILDQQCL